MAYIDYVCNELKKAKPGTPIYVSRISEGLAAANEMRLPAAAAATSVAVKRIMDGNLIPDLRCYQKGIYYRTAVTPFGELGIDKEQLIAEKYLKPDIGYETGPSLLYRMGLTTQLPRERILATNAAKNGTRLDERLGVIIRPAKAEVNAENKAYLQTLDALDSFGKAPINAEKPYAILADHIRRNGLAYEKLLFFADRLYNKNTILQIAHTAAEGENQ